MGASAVTVIRSATPATDIVEVDRQLLTDAEHDSFACLSLKTGQRGADGVRARRQRRNDEVALGTAQRFAADAGGFVGDGHGDARQDRLGLVEHRAIDDGGASLCKHRRGEATENDCQGSAGSDRVQH